MNRLASNSVHWAVSLGFLLSVPFVAQAAEPSKRSAAQVRELASKIDARIDRALQKANLPASPASSDSEFIRRLWLDLHGVLPPAERVVAFLQDSSADKRARLIDETLASNRFGASLGDRWREVLEAPWTIDTDRVPENLLAAWLAERFHRNQPWDRLAADILTASGDYKENGAVLVYLRNVSNYSKSLKPHEPAEIANRLWPALLGVDIHCAQCHDHKSAPVKRTDYWGMTAFLSKLSAKSSAGKTSNILLETGAKPIYGRTLVDELLAYGFDPRTVSPRYLYGEEPMLEKTQDYRPVLAAWATSAKNPTFARNFVNRTWAQLFGRGFAEPLGNFPEDETPLHPELFQELSEAFVAADFDVKHLYRAICNSNAYQRTSQPLEGNRDDKTLLSRMSVKVLNPAQLYDSLVGVLGAPVYQPKPSGGRQTPTSRRAFLLAFESDAPPTAYGRMIPQTLRWMNSVEFKKGHEALLDRVIRPDRGLDEIADDLYLTLLARYPTTAERDAIRKHAATSGDARRAVGQLVWALLNTSEFSVNH